MRGLYRNINFFIFTLFLVSMCLYFEWIYEPQGKFIDGRNVDIFDKLNIVHNKQQKYNFFLSREREELDQDIVKAIDDLEKNKSQTDQHDLRAWFDKYPTPKSSPMDPVMHPLFDGFSIENPTICKTDPVDILIYVHSAIPNKDRRDQIRNTWGGTRIFHDIYVRTVFFLGMPASPNEQLEIQMEQNAVGDIVQGMFNDTFKDLSFKAITALVWINKHCPQAKTIIKADDDIFVDIFAVLAHFIPFLDQEKGQSIACDINNQSMIVRDPKNKWNVPNEYLPSLKTFPKFCSGYFVFMSGNVIPNIYENSFKEENFVPIDDAFVFGVLTNGLANLHLTNIHYRISFLSRPDVFQELKENGKWELITFQTPPNPENLWSLRIRHLTDWEKSHSLYIKLFKGPDKHSVVIE